MASTTKKFATQTSTRQVDSGFYKRCEQNLTDWLRTELNDNPHLKRVMSQRYDLSLCGKK